MNFDVWDMDIMDHNDYDISNGNILKEDEHLVRKSQP